MRDLHDERTYHDGLSEVAHVLHCLVGLADCVPAGGQPTASKHRPHFHGIRANGNASFIFQDLSMVVAPDLSCDRRHRSSRDLFFVGAAFLGHYLENLCLTAFFFVRDACHGHEGIA